MTYVYQTEDSKWIPDEPGPWTQRKQWCEQYCEGRWAYPGEGRFVFWDHRDYFLFLLKWA
jgi:hypothetical protein